MASTAIMISDTVKRDVVYSTKCFDEKPLDANTQLLVEYSVMALEHRLASGPGDIHDVIITLSEYADASIDVISGCLKIGAFAFPPAAPVLLAIAGVGSFIQTLMGLVPDNRPDPVVEKFKQLEKAIGELDEKMTVHFADMQTFITEHNFNVNIMTQASTLMQFMRNCLAYATESDVENFKDAYEQNNPLSLAYSMASLLETRSTNPLIMAMSGEKAKTKTTFNKWKTIITGILGEFLFMETFASGLLKKGELNRNLIVNQWNELTKSLEQWENEYKNDGEYWNELKGDFEKYISNSTHLNNIEKGQEIKKRLDNYLTHDSFYICVFNETKWDKDYTYYCPNEKDQLIGAWGKGRCNAFVYRSRKGGKLNQDAYQNLRVQIRNAEDKLRWNGSLKNIIKEQLLNKSLVTGHGFYCLMGAMHCDPQIYFLNSPAPDWLNKGPGHLQMMHMGRDGGFEEYNFMVGFN